MMLHVPSTVLRRARFVGMQVLNVMDRLCRNLFVGSQCAGSEGSAK